MKEYYVSYEQAVALKRLGFAERTTYEYTEIVEDSGREEWDEDEQRMMFIEDINYYPKLCLDQAAAWMRDCKVIDIEPRVWLVGNKREYRPYIMPPKCKDYIAYPPEESYEQALSAGIDKALELLGKEVKE
ncbi:MAG: hypothetical protein K2H46_02555 [Muribaculaceae bacterium]|nr:hypothetical protein [Muribaculaceae bacterium]